jgi:hypothetical protein
MKVNPAAQRDFKQSWANEILTNFDIDDFGTPEISFRGGNYYIVDGQHRIDALKRWNGPGWEEVAIECAIWTGLDEAGEARLFRRIQKRLKVDAFQDFKTAITAREPIQCDIKNIVETENLVISRQDIKGAISAVGTLMKVYKRDGPEALRRALRIARDSFGDAGLDSAVIDGFGLLCNRYNNGQLNEKAAIEALARINAGVNGLLNKAEQLRLRTGQTRSTCLAAAAVDIINHGSAKNKLPGWWKE